MHEECRYAVHVRKSMFILQRNPRLIWGATRTHRRKMCDARCFYPSFIDEELKGVSNWYFFNRKSVHSTNTHNDVKNIHIYSPDISFFIDTEVSHEAHQVVETGRVPLGVAALVLHAISGTRSWRLSCDAALASGWVIGIWTCRGVRMILYVLRVDEFDRSCWNRWKRRRVTILRIRSKDSSILWNMPRWSMSRDEHQTVSKPQRKIADS